MGNQQSIKGFTLNEFWVRWYQRTGDYSVGPAATLSIDSRINLINHKNSQKILEKYKLSSKTYQLPNYRRGRV